jgi:hypothetical protein
VSAYRYLAEERKAAKSAKAQSGKGQGHEEPPASSEQPSGGADKQVVRLRTKP